jgi:hypothetical protein
MRWWPEHRPVVQEYESELDGLTVRLAADRSPTAELLATRDRLRGGHR